ncbi:HAD family hydrolase [Verminephrobacter aporrectodeae]|uniref:HAD family phosphatase n=1 Tax=Verminephrobacter aporrectodeae subsp. tuberculatae TaxID=1110392 RepID=A0ABT3KPW0_9BURK|nr:HAD family phosphatase [Verminephrobacter aporrectodeae]MCW5220678.1 HAD family phosphatase [Verminephrobacter aporrectodeae subsp. tuberculatae]MCW5255366.1 HAD family phosphatase [Verminephrobacter aporrectodeae subsp. tuberculatae]MCW5289973.1 HAD family phosphatase [Verminephrobacter aporrectodeae subsp. tuberculatae]MCW5320352.1 HAD family phosphatase [Verminephrobacter aporrectodeae subsp. tuberculatae]MCW8176308.1 HAD family phosphatase [Verminephrobacter aporrectodeae subsp. tubercu
MKFEAILFDCDGVLVDSEPIANGVLRDMLEEAGWALTPDECMQIFVGKAVRNEAARIEAHTGRPLTDVWIDAFYARRNAELGQRLTAIEHIHGTIDRVHAHYGGRIACASGADRHKVEMQLAKVGLTPYFEGRVFSGHEMPATKPAPDVYLAAAAALQIAPARCAVVEDTVTGVTAGVAAGAMVFAYAPQDDGAALRAAGATQVFRSMADLPGLLGC